ncbi:MAG: hypothetical protein Q9217_000341 [Psora testacea]
MSQPQAEARQHPDVIDLTEEPISPPPEFTLPPERTPDPLLRLPSRRSPQRQSPRQPQPTEDVIDLSEEDDMPRVTGGRQSSPEIQFLSSRTRSRSLSISRHPERTGTVRPPRRGQLADQQNPLPWSYRPQLPSIRTALRHAAFGNRLAHYDQARDELVGWEGFGAGRQFDLPNMLDVQAIGFDLHQPHRHLQPPPRLPTYDAPSLPRPGFTRSPTEDSLLVCPNCEDELGLGKDEMTRQVWVVKACGHGLSQEERLPQEKPLFSTSTRQTQAFQQMRSG